MYKNILNIKFIKSDYGKIIKKLELGSFMVVPSGPGLATIDIDKKYYKSLLNSDFALADSGFMILLNRVLVFVFGSYACLNFDLSVVSPKPLITVSVHCGWKDLIRNIDFIKPCACMYT